MPFLDKSSGADEQRAHQLSEQLTLLVRQHPELLQLLQNSGGPLSLMRGARMTPELAQALRSYGLDIPEGFSIRNFTQGNGQPLLQVAAPEHMPTVAYAATAGAPLAAAAIPAMMGGGAAGGAAGGGLPPHLGGAAAGAGAGSGILDTILKVAPIGAGLVSKLAGGGFGGGGTGPAGQVPSELSDLLQMSMQRMREQEPLFQAVTKQALAGLPTYAQGK